jgi:hypothetical protein
MGGETLMSSIAGDMKRKSGMGSAAERALRKEKLEMRRQKMLKNQSDIPQQSLTSLSMDQT